MMECMLLPEKPTAENPKVRYVASLKWDGGPFLTFPLRMGHPEMVPDVKSPSHITWDMYQNKHPTPVKDLEGFFQSWLFFGLISEALNANDETDDDTIGAIDATPHLAAQEPTIRSQAQLSVASMTLQDLGASDSNCSPVSNHREQLSPTSSHPPKSDVVLNHRHKANIIQRVYNNFIADVDGTQYLTTRTLVGEIEDSWAISLINFKPSRDQLEMTSVCMYLNIQEYSPVDWDFGNFLGTPDVKSRMLEHGWCPSDLARTVNKFKSLQALHFISMLDKRRPERSHGLCNEYQCQAYQIDPTTYGLTHVEDDCHCENITIDNQEVVAALKQGESIPPLRFVGSKEDLLIEVTPFSKTTQYVAISHVWADGLGNPNGNELRACKLVKLRSLVAALPVLAPKNVPDESTPVLETSAECPLIWLDTLCCPVLPLEDKILSLKKMRQTYERSASVLVLDAGLQCYDSKSMSSAEIFARIFTSSWLRRLWTLQEGALARHLYFQFADTALSLDSLKSDLDGGIHSICYNIFATDIRLELDGILQFFQTKGYSGSGQCLKVLDESLRHRGVSVATDEPLCIGTLMDLPEKPILAVEKDARMRVVWDLLSKKYKSIPAKVIFFEEKRLDSLGFRWAPASFLTIQRDIFKATARRVRWDDPRPGFATSKGLKVRCPGFKLRVRHYNDGKPRHPWSGLKRIPEDRIIFRNAANGSWYSVGTKESALRAIEASTEEAIAYSSLGLFPLHDMMHGHDKDVVHNDKCNTRDVFLLSENDKNTTHLDRNATEGILISGSLEPVSTWTSCISSRRKPISVPILAETRHQVVVGPLNGIETMLYTTVEGLAMTLRTSAITDELLSIADQESEQYKEVLERVKQRMKDLMAQALLENEMLSRAVKMLWGDDIEPYLWTTIGDWFNHGFEGVELEEDQVWFVD